MSTPVQDPFAQAASFLTGGLVAAKWPHEGFVVEGVIKGAKMQQQRDYDDGTPLTWDNGDPRMQLVVDVQSEATGVTWKGLQNKKTVVPNDDGMRAMYVKGNLQKALSKALTAAGAKFAAGAHLRVERVADIPNADSKYADAHDYVVVYTPRDPGQDAADFLSTPEPEQSAPAADENPFAKGADKAPF